MADILTDLETDTVLDTVPEINYTISDPAWASLWHPSGGASSDDIS